MSAPQPEPRSRHGGALDGARPTQSVTASPDGDSPRPDLPPHPGGGRRLPGPSGEITSAGSAGARRLATTQAPLTGADLYDWIALRRVSDGGIARMGDLWFDSGLRVPGYLTDALTALRGNGLVALAEGDAWDVWSLRRAALTDAGTLRYQRLCQHRQAPWQLPADGSAPTVAGLADYPHAYKMVRSVWSILAELEQAGHHPGVITAVRRVLIYHQPTSAGRCRTCRRRRWRRRRFPCIVWHQIHGALRKPC